jgi:5-formyltetrahydrofolate cyclo-ligase
MLHHSMDAKIALRRELLAARRALTPAQLTTSAQRVQTHLAALLRQLSPPRSAQPAPTAPPSAAQRATSAVPTDAPAAGGVAGALTGIVVAAYQPFGTEPGGLDLPEVLRAAGARVILPVLLADKDLDWTDGQTELGVTAIAEAKLIVTPALAVDLAGYRLGRGGGSYDRALARAHPAAFRVALLHENELLPHVPHEPHDQKVTHVLTPAGLTGLDR